MIYNFILLGVITLYAATMTGAYIESCRDEKALKKEIKYISTTVENQDEYINLLETVISEQRLELSEAYKTIFVQDKTLQSVRFENVKLSRVIDIYRKAHKN